MGSGGDKVETIIRNTINQQPIRFKMAFAVFFPIAFEYMIAVTDGQWLTNTKHIDHSK